MATSINKAGDPHGCDCFCTSSRFQLWLWSADDPVLSKSTARSSAERGTAATMRLISKAKAMIEKSRMLFVQRG